MNTDTTLVMHSTGLNETERLGERLAPALKGSEVIELVGDLGSGKTAFVRGLARGLGSKDHVASPTFTINRQYRVKGHPFHTLQHFDFYRLADAGVVKRELAEFIGDLKNVIIIEWPKAVKDILPLERLSIEIKTTAEDERQLTFKTSKELSYLLEGLKNADTVNQNRQARG